LGFKCCAARLCDADETHTGLESARAAVRAAARATEPSPLPRWSRCSSVYAMLCYAMLARWEMLRRAQGAAAWQQQNATASVFLQFGAFHFHDEIGEVCGLSRVDLLHV